MPSLFEAAHPHSAPGSFLALSQVSPAGFVFYVCVRETEKSSDLLRCLAPGSVPTTPLHS